MSPMPTINLRRPIARACVVPATGEEPVRAQPPGGESEPRAAAERTRLLQELEQQKSRLTQLLETVQNVTNSLHALHDQTVARHHADIARLAVEIARKILMGKVARGDYEIQAIVEEALKRAPTRQNIVIRLSPEDLPRCQQFQSENPQGPFAELEFAADGSIGRGECLVETPKGIVKSFIEEHLERISEALQNVDKG